ncbi:MAG TPA: YslB family protein [Pseudoneobacillus sp.]|nr:YslB family protein [Pseudoneobacillus sp.]
MKNTRTAEQDVSLEDISVPSFGYELIREELLTNILGKDAPEILYWSGKQLARSHRLENMTDIAIFFEKAGWGHLTIKKELKNERHFELSSPLIKKRLQLIKQPHFKLEAGFLAQQIETQNGMITEAYEQVQTKAGIVEFIVRWDQKDII